MVECRGKKWGPINTPPSASSPYPYIKFPLRKDCSIFNCGGKWGKVGESGLNRHIWGH